MIHVVSTGFRAPTRQRCLDSVIEQEGVNFTHPHYHHYLDASEQRPPRDVITNIASVVDQLDPKDIVVSLDGDDWLSDNSVLSTVAAMHAQGAWVTYGSFVYADGRAGFAAPYREGEDVRSSPWRATHLKTYRAGLFQRIRREEREWPAGAPVPWDMLVMFAAIEMAGWERVTFCPHVLCVYNYANSHEWRASPRERAREKCLGGKIRTLKPYDRVDGLT